MRHEHAARSQCAHTDKTQQVSAPAELLKPSELPWTPLPRPLDSFRSRSRLAGSAGIQLAWARRTSRAKPLSSAGKPSGMVSASDWYLEDILLESG